MDDRLIHAIGLIAGFVVGALIAHYVIIPALLGGTIAEVARALSR